MELCENITVNGWDFELVENDVDDIFYQCRGEVMYDDDHDEMPEPSLWRAADKISRYTSERRSEEYMPVTARKAGLK